MDPTPENLPEGIARALDELAAEDAADVLAAARSGARAQAQAVLERALVNRLLVRACAGEHPEQPQQHAHGRRVDDGRLELDEDGGEALYLYGVVSADELPTTTIAGVFPGAPLETVVCDGLAAVISRVPLSEFGDEHLKENLERLAWLERTARGHEAVIEVVRTQSTMIPMRLCTLFRSQEAISEMLSREREPLMEALERLAGRSEWGVKALADLARIQLSLPRARETQANQGDVAAGRSYLQDRQAERRVAREVDAWVRGAVLEVHDTLTAAAGTGLRNPVQPRELSGSEDEMVLNGVYLVRELKLDEFRNCFDDLNQRYASTGLRLELTGPWPPYNFVSTSATR
ncbi:MAG TPA: GvpL/GvpF family gas vesicle protein [Leifsonia sp.]|nr:GvpL/GvpF family gas vesicle protein [Leifsonia sp.]